MESIYAKGRDNARTPMQWDACGNAGFTTGTPWLGVNPNYVEINAKAAQSDPDSIFHYYQTLIRLRKELEIFSEGDFKLLLEKDEQIFSYIRHYQGKQMLVTGNFTGREAEAALPEGWEQAQVLIQNYQDVPQQKDGIYHLRPYEAFVKYLG